MPILILHFSFLPPQSGRGRKSLNLGATPKNLPQNASAASPAPASLPHPSPNTTTGAATGAPNVVQSSQQQLVTVSGAQTGVNATLLANQNQNNSNQQQQQQQPLQQIAQQTVPTNNQGLSQQQQQQVPTAGIIKTETMKDQPQQPMVSKMQLPITAESIPVGVGG